MLKASFGMIERIEMPSGTASAIFRIAGVVVQTFPSKVKFEQVLAGYTTSEDVQPDVIVKVIEQNGINIPMSSTVLERGGFRTMVADDGTSYFLYTKSHHVSCSKLNSSSSNRQAVITIFLNQGKGISTLPRWEMRFAIMCPFFAYLFSREMFPLHSCGLSLHGKGILISGASGSGKSSVGRVLVSEYGANCLGEDINACSTNGQFYGMPFSRINSNSEMMIDTVIFLGERTKKLDRAEIENELMLSEFAMHGLCTCIETARKLSKWLVDAAKCFTISHDGQNVNETASLVHDLAFGLKEL